MARDDFHRLGDLAWGRMPGFPFWPCFVTESPEGRHCRGGKGGLAYHVQFFNWNDESGWVTKLLVFNGLADFKALAEKRKSDRSFQPARGAMAAKWEQATREAEGTVGQSRHHRLNSKLVTYGGQERRWAEPRSVMVRRGEAGNDEVGGVAGYGEVGGGAGYGGAREAAGLPSPLPHRQDQGGLGGRGHPRRRRDGGASRQQDRYQLGQINPC